MHQARLGYPGLNRGRFGECVGGLFVVGAKTVRQKTAPAGLQRRLRVGLRRGGSPREFQKLIIFSKLHI